MEVKTSQDISYEMTYEEILYEMIYDGDPTVRMEIAAYKGLSMDMQKLLSADSSADVRYVLARNECLCGAVQMRFTSDANDMVRLAVAGNPNITKAARNILVYDYVGPVVRAAFFNTRWNRFKERFLSWIRFR
jgi:hypothetical protein